MLEFIVPRKRPEQLKGTTTRVTTGCGNLYVTINRDEDGIFEVFGQIGKTGGCAMAQVEAIGKLASAAIRAGIHPEFVIKQIVGIQCTSPAVNGGVRTLSCADGIAQVLQEEVNRIKKAEENAQKA